MEALEDEHTKTLEDLPNELWAIIVQPDWTTNDVLRLRSTSKTLRANDELYKQQLIKWLKANPIHHRNPNVKIILNSCKQLLVENENWRSIATRIHHHVESRIHIPANENDWDTEIKQSINNLLDAAPYIPGQILFQDRHNTEVDIRTLCAILERFIEKPENYATPSPLEIEDTRGMENWGVEFGCGCKIMGVMTGAFLIPGGLVLLFFPPESEAEAKIAYLMAIPSIVLGSLAAGSSLVAELAGNRRVQNVVRNGIRHFIEFCRPAPVQEDVINDEEAQRLLDQDDTDTTSINNNNNAL